MFHKFEPDHYYTNIGTYPPVLHIASGDIVETRTVDARGGDCERTMVAGRPNPQTGPFYVEGAEPGDTLAVTFEKIEPSRTYGFTRPWLAPNVLDPEAVGGIPDETGILEWEIDPVARTATAVLPEECPALVVRINPMLGCFGVAPAGGQAISCATSGPFGGNMDFNGFVEGVTVYLPVAEPGALFFLGDGHAAQGDGEIVGTGIEISMNVRFRLDLHKGWAINWPRAIDTDRIMTVGNARPLGQALQHATTEMLRWLTGELALPAAFAHALLGQCVRYHIGNVYDPAYTVVCCVSKRDLPDAAVGCLPMA